MSSVPSPQVASRPSRRRFSSWLSAATSISALLIALGTALGVCLHLTGHIAHITHLRELGVPSDLFPHGVEWTMINGYYAVFLEWTLTLQDMPWLILLLACVLLAFAIWFYRLPAPAKRSAWIDRRPKWLKGIVMALLASAASITVVFYLLFLVSLITVIPAYIGERAGHHTAQKELAIFRSTDPASAPAEVWQDGKSSMRGHIIAVSSELIAFYDTQVHQVRIIDRANVELRTRPRLQTDLTRPTGHSE